MTCNKLLAVCAMVSIKPDRTAQMATTKLVCGRDVITVTLHALNLITTRHVQLLQNSVTSVVQAKVRYLTWQSQTARMHDADNKCHCHLSRATVLLGGDKDYKHYNQHTHYK